MLKVAKIALPMGVDREFDYYFPAELPVKKGVRVLVDFNGREKVGVVTALKTLPAVSSFKLKTARGLKQLKPVIEVLDRTAALNSEHIRFATALNKLYPYSRGDFLAMMLPACLRNKRHLDLDLPAGSQLKKEKFYGRFIKGDSFFQRYRQWKEIAEEKLREGSVLVCFPQLSYLLKARRLLEQDFPDRVTLIHSRRTSRQIFLDWSRTRQKALILGTRLSIFYYPVDLKLIIVEEENSPYYFQEEKPFYNLRDVALLLSRLKRNALILSGDYPALTTYQLIQNKTIDLEDKTRILSKFKVVDSAGFAKSRIVSPVLTEILSRAVRQDKTVLLLWNKKGFGRTVSCSACGYVLQCEHCSGFLEVSFKDNTAGCPYCQRRIILPRICSQCSGSEFKSTGWGIERLEAVLKRSFPEVRISSWQDRSPESQIILSTSKILSSLYDSPLFDLGIILDLDVFLTNPDYQTAFNAFLYLNKLEHFFKDTFYVFTGNKDYYLFRYLSGEWKKFYEAELELRRELKLPPCEALVKIVLRSKKRNYLLKKASFLYNKLHKRYPQAYGPFPEQPFKFRDKYRYWLVVKSGGSPDFRQTIRKSMEAVRSSEVQRAVIFQ